MGKGERETERQKKRIRNDEFRFRRSRALRRVLRTLLHKSRFYNTVRTGHSYLLSFLRLATFTYFYSLLSFYLFFLLILLIFFFILYYLLFVLVFFPFLSFLLLLFVLLPLSFFVSFHFLRMLLPVLSF